jgi:hypothetical protein
MNKNTEFRNGHSFNAKPAGYKRLVASVIVIAGAAGLVYSSVAFYKFNEAKHALVGMREMVRFANHYTCWMGDQINSSKNPTARAEIINGLIQRWPDGRDYTWRNDDPWYDIRALTFVPIKPNDSNTSFTFVLNTKSKYQQQWPETYRVALRQALVGFVVDDSCRDVAAHSEIENNEITNLKNAP